MIQMPLYLLEREPLAEEIENLKISLPSPYLINKKCLLSIISCLISELTYLSSISFSTFPTKDTTYTSTSSILSTIIVTSAITPTYYTATYISTTFKFTNSVFNISSNSPTLPCCPRGSP